MKRLLFLLGMAISCGCFAAQPPDWVVAGMAADLETWKMEPVVILDADHAAKYVAADKVNEVQRVVLRACTPDGRKDAIAAISFDPAMERIVDARAWVVSADGKKVKNIVRRNFQEEFESYSDTQWDNQRVLYYDASAEIETGGVLAWEFRLESCSPIAQIAHQFTSRRPVVKSRLTVTPQAQAKLQWHITGAGVGQPTVNPLTGELSWVLNRIAKAPKDKAKSVDLLYIPRGVCVRGETNAGAAVDFSSWETLSSAAAKIIYPKKIADATVKAKAAQLTGNASGRWEKIRALCQFVQKDIRYLAITLDRDYLAGYRPHEAPVVLKNRHGDCKDKAILLTALLEAVGEKSYGFLVNSGAPTEVPKDWPSMAFNHIILAVPADENTPATWPAIDGGVLGRLVLFDATDSISPLGVLTPEDRGGPGLLVAEQGGSLVDVPVESATTSGVERTIEAKLDDDGAIEAGIVEVAVGSVGSESYSGRVNQRDDGYGKELESRIHGSLPQLQGFKWSDSWDKVASRHQVKMHFSAFRYGRRLGEDRMMITPRVLSPNLLLDPMAAGFELASVRPCFIDEVVRIALPEGWTVGELPEKCSLESGKASCTISYRSDEGVLVYEARVIQPGGILEKKAYESLCAFMRKAQDALRRPVILKKKS